jgi:NAD(P)-dependent dehydrogenase (short-subunit alcohol dehydrogenase family)
MDVSGKTMLVTGGSSGLGESAVRMGAACGANVVIMDINKDAGAALAEELGEKALFYPTDVTSEEDVSGAIASAVERFGGVHVAVNCAGTGLPKRTISKDGPHDLASFEWLIRLNLIGTFNVASKAAFEMSKNELTDTGERGVIINVASVAAFDGQIGQAAYSASKAGVAGMTLPMARDLAGVGIRVMTIAPGLFDTPLMRMLPEDHLERLNASVPFPRRLGDVAEFARMVRNVIENPYLNGETIRLDGAIRMAPK